MTKGNYEYAHNVLRDWGRELWKMVHPEETETKNPFDTYNHHYSKLQDISQKAFVLACYGLVYIPSRRLSNLASSFLDAVGMDAWRKNMWANHYQENYSNFEVCLCEAKMKLGPEAAIKAFGTRSNAQMVKEGLQALPMKTMVPVSYIYDVLDQIAATQNPTPKPEVSPA